MKTKSKIRLLGLIKYIAMCLPIVILCIINWKNWFNVRTVQGVKVSIGFIITAVTFLLCICKLMPKAPAFVWCLIVGLVFYFLNGIMKDIYTMTLSESIGLFIYHFVNKRQRVFIKQKDFEDQASIQANAIKQVQKELNEEKVNDTRNENGGW